MNAQMIQQANALALTVAAGGAGAADIYSQAIPGDHINLGDANNIVGLMDFVAKKGSNGIRIIDVDGRKVAASQMDASGHCTMILETGMPMTGGEM